VATARLELVIITAVTESTTWQPGFDPARHLRSLLSHFQTHQDQSYLINLHKRDVAISGLHRRCDQAWKFQVLNQRSFQGLKNPVKSRPGALEVVMCTKFGRPRFSHFGVIGLLVGRTRIHIHSYIVSDIRLIIIIILY